MKLNLFQRLRRRHIQVNFVGYELEGYWIPQPYTQLNLTCLQSVNRQFVILCGIASQIKYCSCIDENALVLNIKFPINIESLGNFEPVFDWNQMNKIFLSFASQIKCLQKTCWFCCSYQFIHESSSVWNGEE